MHLSCRRCVWYRCPSPLATPFLRSIHNALWTQGFSGPTMSRGLMRLEVSAQWGVMSMMQSGGADPLEATFPTGTRTRFESRKTTVAFEGTQMAEALHHSLSCAVAISRTRAWSMLTQKDRERRGTQWLPFLSGPSCLSGSKGLSADRAHTIRR